MNEVLFELARVVRGGGRVVFDLEEIRVGGAVYNLEEELLKVVEEGLPGYWNPESILLSKEKSAQVGGAKLRRDVQHEHRILVLRRK